MNKTNCSKRGPLRWELSHRLLHIIQHNPSITAQELQLEGASVGIEISIRTAFRFLKRYRMSEGNIFKSAKTHLQTVADILLKTPSGKHLSPLNIKEQAAEHGDYLHLSTVYRILRRLVDTGTVVQLAVGKQVVYQWNRQAFHNGHITCTICGKQIEFQKDYLDGMAKSICSTFGAEHYKCCFVLYARCRQCCQ